MKHKISLALHITHPSADLFLLCKEIGLEPKIYWNFKDVINVKSPKLQFRTNSYCSIHFEIDKAPLQEQFTNIIKLLYNHKEKLIKLYNDGGRFSFYIGMFFSKDSGEVINWEVMSMMVELRISLEFLFYVEPASSRT